MNFSKVMSLISENNINPDEVLRLVDKVRRLDMKNENYAETFSNLLNCATDFINFMDANLEKMV